MVLYRYEVDFMLSKFEVSNIFTVIILAAWCLWPLVTAAILNHNRRLFRMAPPVLYEALKPVCKFNKVLENILNFVL